MNKQTYDILLLLGFQILNYPPKINEASPTFIKMSHFRFSSVVQFHKDDDLNRIFQCISSAVYEEGYNQGLEHGEVNLQIRFKTLMGL